METCPSAERSPTEGLQTPAVGLSGVLQASVSTRIVGQLGGPFAYAGGSLGEGPQITGGIFQGDSCGVPGNQVVGEELGVGGGLDLLLPGQVHGGGSNTLTATYVSVSPSSIATSLYNSWTSLARWR